MHKRPFAILFFALLLALTYAYSQPQAESMTDRFRRMSQEAVRAVSKEVADFGAEIVPAMPAAASAL